LNLGEWQAQRVSAGISHRIDKIAFGSCHNRSVTRLGLRDWVDACQTP
jgi:hypothetical protein